MDRIDLRILSECFEAFEEGIYSVDAELLVERMLRLYKNGLDNIEGRIDDLWENDFLTSSNGQYYLTHKSLKLIQELDSTIN